MKLHWGGTYNNDPESLPASEHRPGAVKFKEAETSARLAVIASIIAIAILIVTYALVIMRGFAYADDFMKSNFIAFALLIVTMLPHELIHAACFKDDVWVYTNLKQGMLFVIGPEDMSKGRFIFMSLLPAIVLGFTPFIIFMIWPVHLTLGFFAAFSLSSAAGDFYNVFNAATQMPKGSRTYLHGFNSYWYMPETPEA